MTSGISPTRIQIRTADPAARQDGRQPITDPDGRQQRREYLVTGGNESGQPATDPDARRMVSGYIRRYIYRKEHNTKPV